jgi:diacylglycerol kinase
MFRDFPRERNALIMLAIGVFAIGLGFVLGISRIEWMILVGCIGVVLGTEAMNSAIERSVDLTCRERNEIARAAKDLAAASSRFLWNAPRVIWVFIFVPRIASLI